MIIIEALLSTDTPATTVLRRCHQREAAFRTSRRVRLGSLGCASRCSVLVYRWFGRGKSRKLASSNGFPEDSVDPHACPYPLVINLSISVPLQRQANGERSQLSREPTDVGRGLGRGSTARLTWRLQVSNLVSILVRRKRLPP